MHYEHNTEGRIHKRIVRLSAKPAQIRQKETV